MGFWHSHCCKFNYKQHTNTNTYKWSDVDCKSWLIASFLNHSPLLNCAHRVCERKKLIDVLNKLAYSLQSRLQKLQTQCAKRSELGQQRCTVAQERNNTKLNFIALYQFWLSFLVVVRFFTDLIISVRVNPSHTKLNW